MDFYSFDYWANLSSSYFINLFPNHIFYTESLLVILGQIK